MRDRCRQDRTQLLGEAATMTVRARARMANLCQTRDPCDTMLGQCPPRVSRAPWPFCSPFNILNFYDRQVLGALLEPIRKEFHLSDTQLGALGDPAHRDLCTGWSAAPKVADSGSRKRLLAVGIAVWASLTVIWRVGAKLPDLVVSRVGVFRRRSSPAHPPPPVGIGELFPTGRRSRALAIFMLGVPIGGAISYAMSGPVRRLRDGARHWWWPRCPPSC